MCVRFVLLYGTYHNESCYNEDINLPCPCFFHAVACVTHSLTLRDSEFAEQQQRQQHTVIFPSRPYRLPSPLPLAGGGGTEAGAVIGAGGRSVELRPCGMCDQCLVVPGHDFVLGRVSGSSSTGRFRLGRSSQCRAANEHAGQAGQVRSSQVRSDQVRLAGPETGGKKGGTKRENMRLGERRYGGRVRATVSGEVRTRSLFVSSFRALAYLMGVLGSGSSGAWLLAFVPIFGAGRMAGSGSCSGSGSGSGFSCSWFGKGGGIASRSLVLLSLFQCEKLLGSLAAANRGALEGIPSMPNWYPSGTSPVFALYWICCRSIIPSACS